jgi:hypothetical protein
MPEIAKDEGTNETKATMQINRKLFCIILSKDGLYCDGAAAKILT